MTDANPAIDPRRTALLVMDYQNAIIGRLSDPGALLARMADASADPDPEVHEFLTGRVFPAQAHVITTADLDALLS